LKLVTPEGEDRADPTLDLKPGVPADVTLQ